jgi:hypothetical protein
MIPWLGFGLATAAAVVWLGPSLPSGNGRLDLLLASAGLAGLWTAVAWLAWLGASRSTGWAIAWGICLWIPYVNLVLASLYARRYWSDGARSPALLGMAAMAVQSIVALRLLQAPLISLV